MNVLLFVVAFWLLILALLAYRWSYTTTTWNRAHRRNQQMVLVAALLAAAAAVAGLGISKTPASSSTGEGGDGAGTASVAGYAATGDLLGEGTAIPFPPRAGGSS